MGFFLQYLKIFEQLILSETLSLTSIARWPKDNELKTKFFLQNFMWISSNQFKHNRTFLLEHMSLSNILRRTPSFHFSSCLPFGPWTNPAIKIGCGVSNNSPGVYSRSRSSRTRWSFLCCCCLCSSSADNEFGSLIFLDVKPKIVLFIHEYRRTALILPPISLFLMNFIMKFEIWKKFWMRHNFLYFRKKAYFFWLQFTIFISSWWHILFWLMDAECGWILPELT